MPFDVLQRILGPLRLPARSSRYPVEAPLLAVGVRGLPELDQGRCTRDAACVAICPTGAISLSETDWSIDAGRCVFCALCADACPSGAITLGTQVELGARGRADLVHVTPVGPPR